MFMGSVIKSKLSQRTSWLVVIVSIMLLGALYGFLRGARKVAMTSVSPASDQRISATPVSAVGNNETISYRGVSFSYSGSLASDIKTETKPANLLQLSTDTGQGVAPEHIVFQLLGPYTSLHKSSFFSPDILIFPIEGYRHALAKSQRYVNKFDHRLEIFKEMLSRRPESWNGEVPVLPFAVGGSQCFHARLEYVRFKNGVGVIFLTQYNIEPALINNEGLAYTFQGLTDDQLYWVSATFPVSVSSLPESYESGSTEDYTLVIPRSFRGHEYDSFENSYRRYLDRLTGKLERLPTSGYQPDLATLREMILSLSIKPEL